MTFCLTYQKQIKKRKKQEKKTGSVCNENEMLNKNAFINDTNKLAAVDHLSTCNI